MTMELQKTKHQIKLEEWRRHVEECRSSELTVKSWCEENQINVQTYYRWQKKVWESGAQNTALSRESPGNITFTEYRPLTYTSTSGVAMTLHIGQVRLEIQNGADTETIENAIRAISKLC